MKSCLNLLLKLLQAILSDKRFSPRGKLFLLLWINTYACHVAVRSQVLLHTHLCRIKVFPLSQAFLWLCWWNCSGSSLGTRAGRTTVWKVTWRNTIPLPSPARSLSWPHWWYGLKQLCWPRAWCEWPVGKLGMVRAVWAGGAVSKREGHLWIKLFLLLAFCSHGLHGCFRLDITRLLTFPQSLNVVLKYELGWRVLGCFKII